ncbi:hypothetical protein [Aurantiacibacter sediminis]|uniref:Uncharacterized protein n=1 Tax=Aurantiacibacter sediminis TaxID=2793064 RepID=A0ABS0N4N8_9SPHN|nr:hypothetical protein [Aurantiacibacter sediminis]MBH5322244.1 hypothetical protein [Aurantiacibacter sediminis]
MKFLVVTAALGLGTVLLHAPAEACMQDRDCVDTRTSEEREADAAEIRRLNLEQARYVRQRDARNAPRVRAYDEQFEQQDRYREDMADYERDRADYEAEVAAWRRAVRLCRAGHYEYCD